MLFNSYIFILAFLPTTLVLFFWLGQLNHVRSAIGLLVAASLGFYGWWNPIYVPLILASMLTNYGVGRVLDKAVAARRKAQAKMLLTAGIIFNLGLLGYFKYANFFVDSINAVSGADIQLAQIALPLAISFFTFQQIAYLADVYKDEAEEYDLLRYALFVTFFPQLIAGPIVHHREMMPQFRSSAIGRFSSSDFAVGLSIFVIGLFKKVVLADSISPLASAVFDASAAGNTIAFTDAWLGSFAYSFEIYFDFSGYSDMAIGLARMFGICLPLNFNSPYKATGIIEFWRRWHMTLSRFLRDFLYIPLGGNRHGEARRYTNMMIVMLLGGLWHGAGWNFVIWGGLHGCYLMVNHAWRVWRGDKRSPGMLANVASTALTFLVVTVAWVFFRAENFPSAINIISAMVGLNGVSLPVWMVNLQVIGPYIRELPVVFADIYFAGLAELQWLVGLLLIAWFLPNTQQLMTKYMDPQRYKLFKAARWQHWLRWEPRPVSAFVIAVLTVCAVISLGGPSEFIYYQF
jgi:D-alanyl-lipoteichoic acid acyltransferase DltB (MBOAT superfamily)